jgi:hypothetical protein
MEFGIGEIVVSVKSGREGRIAGFDKKTALYTVECERRSHRVHASDIKCKEKVSLKVGDTVYCYGMRKTGVIIAEDDFYPGRFFIDFGTVTYSFNSGALKYVGSLELCEESSNKTV